MDTEIDVIVFESGDRRFAIELRYVQEVCTLGYVTQVPLAPPTIEGATSVRGRMVPVVSIHPLFSEPSPSAVLPGTPAILVTIDEAATALPVRRIIDVASVPRSRLELGGQGSGPLIPGYFHGPAGSIPLLDIAGALTEVVRTAHRANDRIHRKSEAR